MTSYVQAAPRMRRSIEELPFTPLGLVGRPEAPRLAGTSRRNALGYYVVVRGYGMPILDRISLESINVADYPDWLEY